MRVYSGPTVTLASDATREVGKTIVRDGSDSTITQQLLDSGKIGLTTQIHDVDYFIDFVPKSVIYQDSPYRGAINWTQIAGTHDIAVTNQELIGASTWRLVTGGAAGNQAGMSRRLPGFAWKKLRFVVLWAYWISFGTTPRSMEFNLWQARGGNSRECNIRHLSNSAGAPQNKWQFEDTIGVWADITGGAETVDASVTYSDWNKFDAIIDFDMTNPQITELHTNALDLTGLTHDGFENAGAFIPYLMPTLRITTDIAAASTAYICFVGIYEVP